MKNTVSGGGIIKVLGGSVINAPGGNIISRTTQRFINSTKVSDPISGRTHKLKDLLKKPTINKKLVADIFAQAEKKGILREKPWTKTSSRFFEKATQEDKKITVEEMKRTKESQNIPAKNKQPETVKPEDKKASNIYLSRKRSLEAGRGREIGSMSKLDQVREAQSKFRETYGKSSEIGVKSRGAPTEGGLIGHAVKEGEKSDSLKKSGQNKGGNAPADQKSGGHQPVKLQGSVVDRLTRQPVARDENLPGVFSPVKGLDKAPASQPETPPAPRSATDINDITDLDIG